MAYDKTERFSKVVQSFPLLDPGSYQTCNSLLVKPNKVPFLTKKPRKTQFCSKIWTHALYSGDKKVKIPNCTSISSKTPRFAYEKWNDDGIVANEEYNICQCGLQDSCECPIESEQVKYSDLTKTICQAKFQRQLFRGVTLRSPLGESLSCPSKRDQGFQILPDGSRVRILKQGNEDCLPFYDIEILESNAFYRGCKWSRRTSPRTDKTIKFTPGPADYNIDRKPPSYEAICAEKVRAFKRKTSKQLRFLDKIQRHNVLEALPGPASYSPIFPTGTNLKVLSSKAKRFKSTENNETPEPTKYFIKRDFDIANSLHKPCLVKLPSCAPFGVRDQRFKYRLQEGPSPASYDLQYVPCHLVLCKYPPFGTTSKRFQDNLEKNNVKYEDLNIENDTIIDSHSSKPLPTWEFRSKTVRMKSLRKRMNEPSPADLPQSSVRKERLLQFQLNCPFFSSEARFRRWYNWIPVQANEKTQGPAYYNLEKPYCFPNVNRSGPLYRSPRFTWHALQTPAPNEYKAQKGIENILKTYNQRLNNNIANKHKFYWKSPVEKRKLTQEEQELKLLNKSIALLNVPDIFEYKKVEIKKKSTKLVESKPKEKLLRYFMYAHQVKRYF